MDFFLQQSGDPFLWYWYFHGVIADQCRNQKLIRNKCSERVREVGYNWEL